VQNCESLEILNFSNNRIASGDQEYGDFIASLADLLKKNDRLCVDLSVNYVSSSEVLSSLVDYYYNNYHAMTEDEVAPYFSRLKFLPT
jgi:hypothetical protein